VWRIITADRHQGSKQYRSYGSFMGSPHALKAFGSREQGDGFGYSSWMAKVLVGNEIEVRSSTGVTDPLWDHHRLLKLSGRESRGMVSAIPRGWQRGWLEARSRFGAVPELPILHGITTGS
jgi:hypothetical protein